MKAIGKGKIQMDLYAIVGLISGAIAAWLLFLFNKKKIKVPMWRISLFLMCVKTTGFRKSKSKI